MKKIMLLMMAALAITTISCKKDNKGGDDEEGTIAKPTYRVKSYTHGKDFFNYSWNKIIADSFNHVASFFHSHF